MEKKLIKLFDFLFHLYGPQNWWPADSPWEVCVGAILTQNTNWKNVEKAILNLKNADLIGKGEGGRSSKVIECPDSGVDVDYTFKILEINPEQLAELIRPSGYFNLKTKRLLSLAKWWINNTLNDKPINADIELNKLRKSLLDVNGIGKETADTIILYAFNLPLFVVDTYTKRICSLYLNTSVDIPYDDLQSIFMDNLPHDNTLYNEYHALIVRLAKEKEWKKIIEQV